MNNSDKNSTRRNFLKIIGAGAIGLAIGEVSKAGVLRRPETKMLVYVGTYTSGKSALKSEGIYIYKFDSATGKLVLYKTIKNVVEPSFLVVDDARKFLFAVNETVDFEGKPSGAISAFAINQKDGDLEFLNQQPSLGGAPCYVTVSKNGRFVLAANYVGGNVAVLPVGKDGKLGAAVDLAQQHGSSVNRERQESAHAHFIALDKTQKFAFSCDLGADKIFIYNFDQQTGKLSPNAAQPFFQAKAGAGPRHLAFHENEKFVFVINELNSTISTLLYNRKTGQLNELQSVSTLPPNFTTGNTCAEIYIAPNGKFLYGSNRGHDSIVSFRITDETGKLEYVEHVSTGGKKPRNFSIDPTGNFLLVANQDSDNITVFRIDQSNGKLKLISQMNDVPTPVCLKFILSF